jgi:hypothetical protein
MAKKEVLDRAEGQGYVLAQASKGKALAHPKAAQPAKKNPPAKSSAASTSPRPQLNGRKDQPSARKNLRNKPSPRPDSHGRTAQPTLRMVLLDLLKKSKHHVAGSELAQQVLKTGYRTSSRNFTDVVWVMLGKMDEVEHLPGKGYRLKKRSR